MPKKKVDVFLIALSSPILIGIYEDKKLIQTITSQEKSSEILPVIYKELFQKYEIERLLYVNGPGSFMAIKVAYIFLQSLSILKKIPLMATDGFKMNNNKPIKAIGKLYFVKIASEIVTQKLENIEEGEFTLPQILSYDEFSSNTTPLYSIGAVG
ncbi:TsaB protein, required for threonylcarbamoyladenosine (t(6)A) formation in tRNA [hydrothermal vent metagenome]|uniref:TsaB protein, required for threonylcarbamoyladenosine (T(6)A) formation in tRNA n=1 Tax=hydrothermal vent metagenome TaxID=652676 RepID=A0A1W1D2T1_9ZZZZ